MKMHIISLLIAATALLPASLSTALPDPVPNPDPDPNLNIIVDLPSEAGSGSGSKVLPARVAAFTPPLPPPPPPMPECLGSWQCPNGKVCKDNKCIAKKESHLQILTENLNSETVLSETERGGPKLPCEKHSDCGPHGYCFQNRDCV
ncbi:hypothetical protein DL98DRAFT_647749 [Cadophora sp. DSE1049]|nr:hypothetical protein DL98DRAFT_647749 [Cadophora sp. DSE1049]